MSAPPERDRCAPPPSEGEPEFLRRARHRRAAWDLYFPMLVGVVVLVLLVLVAVVPSMRDPTVLGVLGPALAVLAGLGLRKGSP